MRGSFAFLAALLLGPATGLANWEFTRWGMTVDEVQRASRYDAILNGQGFGCLLEMPGPIRFQGSRFDKVLFCFDDDTLLRRVELVADASAYAAIERTLQQAYGAPRLRRSLDMPERYWSHPESGDMVQLSLEENAVVTYREAPAGSN
ncbi:hypothetical protein JL101_020775 [Skermanella rosea]|uniref:hypothetical protein n=1 Tax=Skermanella rosea TaxID=1817965 RepID=UPI0019325C66|nr:hypothetical protein [Skermanella rosea]UEM02408.1 hypothetical protein JL101_020775 [Skermanella rosea]